MGRLGVALVLSLSAAGLVHDASGARQLGGASDIAAAAIGAGSADARAADATAYFPSEELLSSNRRLLSLTDLKKQMLELQLAQMKEELESKLENMDTDELVAAHQSLADDGSDVTDGGEGGDIDDAVQGVLETIQEDVTVEDAVEMVREVMVDDAATLAEGVASVQVTLADEPDSTEAVGDADIEAADDESAETDESADDEAALTLEEAEEVVAAAQEEAAAGAAESDGDIGGGGGEEAAPIGLRVDRANPVPPKAPRKENPNLIRRGTDPALDTRFAEDGEEDDEDDESKPKYFGVGGAATAVEITAFGPEGGDDAEEEAETGLIWTAQDKLRERSAKAVAAVAQAAIPMGGEATKGMSADQIKAAEAAHLATFAEDEQGAAAAMEAAPARKEQTVDDQTGSEESAALLNQRKQR